MLAESMRKRIGWLVFQVLSVATGAFGQSDPRAKLEATFARTVRPFLATHCVTCHGSKQPAAQMDLSGFTSMAALIQDGRRWSQILERLEAGEMPPKGARAVFGGAARCRRMVSRGA
ncbi:MAG: hypothetical protein FJW32_09690 [Acidobacteria bacterium]|nr:hypothetical protein [Acidobacteriota bacterium]